ncbi:MAG: hypothetical protein AB8B80_11075 [Marinicellaceae bacterium]
MIIKVNSSAKKDLKDGYSFYEKQEITIGSYFLDSLFSDIDSLKITAGIHQITFNKYYRLLSKRFPFAIYYTIQNNTIHVEAILDCRRKPAWIRERLKNN